MQTLKSCLWRQVFGRLAIYRTVRHGAAKDVITPLRPELLSNYLLRDLGLPPRHADLRHPRL